MNKLPDIGYYVDIYCVRGETEQNYFNKYEDALWMFEILDKDDTAGIYKKMEIIEYNFATKESKVLVTRKWKGE